MINVLHTPGHLKESISLLVNDEFIFTGDTIRRGWQSRLGVEIRMICMIACIIRSFN